MACPKTLLSVDDFIDEVKIAGTEQKAISDAVCDFIAKYEPDFLERVLGLDLFTAIYADWGLTVHEQRFDDILNGEVYTINGNNVSYKGIKPSIIRYVYFYYLQNNATFTSVVSEVKGTTAVSNSVSGIDKQVTAWNQMSDQLWSLWKMLVNRLNDDGTKTYPEFTKESLGYCWCYSSDYRFGGVFGSNEFAKINSFGI